MNNLDPIKNINLFVERWPIEQIYRLNIEDYIDSHRGPRDKSRVGSIDTFSYWTEFSFRSMKTHSLGELPKNDFVFNPTQWKRYGIVLNRSFPTYLENKIPQSLKNIDEADPFSSDTEEFNEKEFLDTVGLDADGFEIEEFDENSLNEEHGNSPDYFDFDDMGTWDTSHSFVSGREVQARDPFYSWRPVYGSTSSEAFHRIHNEIIEVVEGSLSKDFRRVASTLLPDSFALRIAYLYAVDDLIPIFRRATLERCAFALGFVSGDSDWVSLQSFLLERRPLTFRNNFQYARYLLKSTFSGISEDHSIKRRVSGRVSTRHKSVESQTRRAVESYSVEQRHNLLQNALYRKLAAKFGDEAVILEENWVDVKLYLHDEIVFYEVKSDLSASACVRNALGQGLNYICSDQDSRPKRLVVVGPAHTNEQDRLFIEFVKRNLLIDFDYECMILQELS